MYVSFMEIYNEQAYDLLDQRHVEIPIENWNKVYFNNFFKKILTKPKIFRLWFLKMIMETLISKTSQSTIAQTSRRGLIFWWWATSSVKSVQLPWINVPLDHIACSLLPLRVNKRIRKLDFAPNYIWLIWRGQKESRKHRWREAHWTRRNTSICHWPIWNRYFLYFWWLII